MWVCPGVRARVTSMTAKPWDEYRVMCSLCKKEGHKAWDCTQQTECFRCKASTHTSADCPHCCTCRKYGYLAEDCKTGQLSNDDASRELPKQTKQNTNKDNKKKNRQIIQGCAWTENIKIKGETCSGEREKA